MLYIDGKWGPAISGRSFESTNPATDEVLGSVADAGVDDDRAAIDAAHTAFDDWADRTAYQRAAVLHRATR